MKKKIEAYYQRLILEDIDRPRYVRLKKIFPWIIGAFAALQVVYYFLYFHGRVGLMFKRVMYVQNTRILHVYPKEVVFAFDDLLLFLLYLFFIFVFFVLSFIAFDSMQRSKIIRKLKDENQRGPSA